MTIYLSSNTHQISQNIWGCLEISKYIHKYLGTVGAEIIWRPLTARRRFMTKIFPHPLSTLHCSASLRCTRSYGCKIWTDIFPHWGQEIRSSLVGEGGGGQGCRVYNTSYFQAGTAAEIGSLLCFYSISYFHNIKYVQEEKKYLMMLCATFFYSTLLIKF